MRIVVSSGVRWIGHEQKCFRFEVLGCLIREGASGSFVPDISFSSAPLPSGFLSARWSDPAVVIAGRETVYLDTADNFLVTASSNGETNSEFRNTTSHGLILPRPLWGSDYTFGVKCIYQGREIDCGEHYVESASIYDSSEDCFAHAAGCAVGDFVQFVSPTDLEAVTRLNGSSVRVDWRLTDRGWVPPQTQLRIEDATGGRLVSPTRVVSDGETSVDIERGIAEVAFFDTEEYLLVFSPAGEGVPNGRVVENAAVLALLRDPNSIDEEDTVYAFIADVSLSANIIWSGKIRARWEVARALAESPEDLNKPKQMTADSYNVQLRLLGSEHVLRSEKTSETGFSFGGIVMGAAYQVELTCVFWDRQIPCGSRIVGSGEPLHNDMSPDGVGTSVFIRTQSPDNWAQLEDACSASGGHLVSLNSLELEEKLAEATAATSTSDYWSGGNMCNDYSPPSDESMWSDGSEQDSANFAVESGLDWGHCCVKVGRIFTGLGKMLTKSI